MPVNGELFTTEVIAICGNSERLASGEWFIWHHDRALRQIAVGFLLVSQFSVTGELYTCRPDLVGFVNGLPLVVIELKRRGRPISDAIAQIKYGIPHGDTKLLEQ